MIGAAPEMQDTERDRDEAKTAIAQILRGQIRLAARSD